MGAIVYRGLSSMVRRYYEITFTDSVRAAQRQYGGAEFGTERAIDPRTAFGPREEAFIAARDSFYLSTVAENGWPYVQHRGGPAGFLKVLDPVTLGFADFHGNRQYMTAGNLAHDGRVSLILVDYPQRRRLKILGHCRVEDARSAEPDLLARLSPTTDALVERLLLIRLEAFDWNCSQHITPRYTEAEWRAKFSAT
ncbi:MAG TPA: pyridoxamine 5'-phosphate oxidase family protein [Rhodocyclaceae bacterium]|nr:pyridoxamine 5'-phosphate oxidase family protein [Rhodocyclaceae bacterium]